MNKAGCLRYWLTKLWRSPPGRLSALNLAAGLPLVYALGPLVHRETNIRACPHAIAITNRQENDPMKEILKWCYVSIASLVGKRLSPLPNNCKDGRNDVRPRNTYALDRWNDKSSGSRHNERPACPDR